MHNATVFITGSAHLIPNVPAMTSPSWPRRHGVALALFVHASVLVPFWDALLAAAVALASPSQTKQVYVLFWGELALGVVAAALWTVVRQRQDREFLAGLALGWFASFAVLFGLGLFWVQVAMAWPSSPSIGTRTEPG
jgi:hypothetical protein